MQLNSEPIKKEIKLDFKEAKYATGRRKKSIARVWLKKGTGDMYVNGKKLADYFARSNLQKIVKRPLSLTKRESEFDVKCTVSGGGLSGPDAPAGSGPAVPMTAAMCLSASAVMLVYLFAIRPLEAALMPAPGAGSKKL